MSARVRVRSLRADDWPAVRAIHAAGIADGDATFETAPPSWEGFDGSRLAHLRLVAVDEREERGAPGNGAPETVLGWAAASPTSTRRVYAGVAEPSVYVATGARGRGVGRALLADLVRLGEATGTWSLRSGIFAENPAGLALHAAAGFRVLGRQERVGRMAGRWRDVLLVERRSDRVGDDGPLVRLALDGAAATGTADDDAACRLLHAEGLPTDLDGAWRLWVADADGTAGDIAGAVALERHVEPGTGHVAFLLRSLVVRPDARGAGLGRRLVEAALTTADLDGGRPAAVGMLTDSAASWFSRLDFRTVDRADLPVALAAARQVAGGCGPQVTALLRDR